MSANPRAFLAAALLALSACTPASPGPTAQQTSSSSVASLAKSSAGVATSSASSRKQPTPAPKAVDLDVPFSPQAPTANWDAVHEETCEEMSLIMAMHYVKGDRGNLGASQAEDELQKLIAWQTNHGYGYDVTIAELADAARSFYGLNARIRDDVTKDSIKEELVKGNPVIIPAAGRMLGNPYFSGDGPWYHMLVITGYREGLFGTIFITNDPGTRRGDGYEYKSDVLLAAIHDWTGVKEEIARGKKTMLIVTVQD